MESEQDKKLRLQVEEVKARKEREEKARKKAEEEAKKKEAEDLEKERIRKEEEDKERQREEEEAARLLKEEEERKRKEEEEEKERLRKEEEEERLRKEEEEKEEERLRKEEEDRRRKEEEEEEERRRAEEYAKAAAEEAAAAAAAAATAAAAAAATTLDVEPQPVEFYGDAEPDSGSPTPPSKETEEEGEIIQDSLVDLTQKSIDDKLRDRESLRIDTSPVKLAHPSDFPRKLRPAQLDLSSTSKNASIPAPPHSALATARNIEDLGRVPYPEGVMSPKVELNVNAKDGKFR